MREGDNMRILDAPTARSELARFVLDSKRFVIDLTPLNVTARDSHWEHRAQGGSRPPPPPRDVYAFTFVAWNLQQRQTPLRTLSNGRQLLAFADPHRYPVASFVSTPPPTLGRGSTVATNNTISSSPDLNCSK